MVDRHQTASDPRLDSSVSSRRRRSAANRILCTALGLLACNLAAADEGDFRCLRSVGASDPMRLQFTFPAGSSDMGYVAYQKGSGRIQVKQKDEKELGRATGGRPSATQSRWEEVTADGTGGTYVLTTRGALVEDFRYLRKKDGRSFRFEDDPDAAGDKGCKWSTGKR